MRRTTINVPLVWHRGFYYHQSQELLLASVLIKRNGQRCRYGVTRPHLLSSVQERQVPRPRSAFADDQTIHTFRTRAI